MKITFLGTGDAWRVPVYGCQCRVCKQARPDPARHRSACSLCVEVGGRRLLIDAGQRNLPERFPPGSLDAILLTHYHMDHVAGLFELRWGVGRRIPVYGPADPQGCDDLYKHPGLLDFRPPLQAFHPLGIDALEVHPVPLIHSRPCFGYVLCLAGFTLAYLTDTVGLSAATEAYLGDLVIDLLVLDCTFPPAVPFLQEGRGVAPIAREEGDVLASPRNHNDWTQAAAIWRALQPRRMLLTHIGHDMDCWLLDNPLPPTVGVARDGLELNLEGVSGTSPMTEKENEE